MGDFISWASGVALLFFGSAVICAYRPRGWPERDSAKILQAAIFFGFIAGVGNTLFWQVLGQPLVEWGVLSVAALRNVGDWLDLVFKGGAAFAAYLHLKALHLSLPSDEREHWAVLEMPFYPKRNRVIVFLKKTFVSELR